MLSPLTLPNAAPVRDFTIRPLTPLGIVEQRPNRAPLVVIHAPQAMLSVGPDAAGSPRAARQAASWCSASCG
jgi:hypothetical protein